jgi:O-antigen ligase
MTQRNSRLILIIGAILGIIALFIDNGIIPFILFASISILIALFSVSLLSILSVLLFVRPSLDIFGTYSFVLYSDLPAINIAGLVAIISIIISILIIYKSKISIFSIPLSGLFMGLFGVYIIFASISIYPLASINELVRVLSFLLMYITGYIIIKSKKDLLYIITLFIISSIIPAIVGYIQLFNGAGLYTNPGFENRIAGTFGHPNVLGYFLLIIIALMVYMFFENSIKQPLYKVAFVGYGILLAILLIATYTRGAWIGLALLLVGVSLIRYTKKTLIMGSIITPIIVIGVAGYIWLEQNIWYNLTPLEDVPVIARVVGLFNGDPSDSIIWRQVMWADMYNKGLSRPWTGFGTGTIETVVEQVRGVSLGALEAHNDYIKIFVEMGIIGLVAYVLFIVGIVYSLLIRIQSRKDTLLLIMTFLVFAIYLSSIWDNLLRQTAVMWIFFGLLGMVIKYTTIRPKQSLKNLPIVEQ